jgi:hypothetical protein
MRGRVDVLAQHPARLTLREIVDDPSCGFAGKCAFICRPLHDGENGRLRGPWLTFASPAQTRTVGILSGRIADIELVHLDGAVELILAGDEQAQSVAHEPGGWLADPDRLGQASRLPWQGDKCGLFKCG